MPTVPPPVEFGGQGPWLHLYGANGFPPETYAPLIARLRPYARIFALPPRPLWPEADPRELRSWIQLAEDLIAGLEAHAPDPVVALGHSLGGTVSLLAAARRPDLFRALLLIEPALLPPLWLRGLALLRPLGVLPRIHPLVRGARRRRRRWPDADAVRAYLRRKPLFRRWTEESREAYLAAGTRPTPDGGRALRFPPEWEARIFETPPVETWRWAARVRIPLLLLLGEDDADRGFPNPAPRLGRLCPQVRVRVLPGGHMLPFEDPDRVAREVAAFLEEGIPAAPRRGGSPEGGTAERPRQPIQAGKGGGP